MKLHYTVYELLLGKMHHYEFAVGPILIHGKTEHYKLMMIVLFHASFIAVQLKLKYIDVIIG